MEEGYGEYDPKIVERLEKAGADVFDRIRLWEEGRIDHEGVLLPRPGYGDPRKLILKLDNGYNVGFLLTGKTEIKLIKKRAPSKLVRISKPSIGPGLPRVAMLGTGGTIASRIDYRTGAVYPFFTAQEIYSMIPELKDLADIKAETVFNIFSEDMKTERWSMLAESAAHHLTSGARGVVIAHGTDTMGYTAAALSFSLRNLPGPVVLVGAQRSSDRPSSDTTVNVIASIATAAYAPFAEVVVVMHRTVGDEYCLTYRGTKTRKCHTSRRDAFASVNAKPLALIKGRSIEMLEDDYFPRSDPSELVLEKDFDEKTALVKFYPGMTPEILDSFIDRGYHGIVLEGSGLGHIATNLLTSVERGIQEGIAIVMSSQCIWGRINMNIYRTGIRLLKAGVISAADMLPETAYVKLSWVLAKTKELEEVRNLMARNFAHEISPCSEETFYPNTW